MPKRRIVLDLDAVAPVSGRVSAPPDFAQSFTGWISLLAVLEAAVGLKEGPDPRPRERSAAGEGAQTAMTDVSATEPR